MHEITARMRAVERAVATSPGAPDWRGELADRIAELRAAFLADLGRSMRSAEATAASAPWLSTRLTMLRREQARIADDFDSLVEACAELDVETLRRHVFALLSRLARSRQLDVNLLYESVDIDLGGEQ